ncbi:MAG: hypothetical protein R3F59_14670 [Myxococcota bacterium]
MRRKLLLGTALLSAALAVGLARRPTVTSPSPTAAPPAPRQATPPAPPTAAPAPQYADVHCEVEGAPGTRYGDLYEVDPPEGRTPSLRHTVRIEGGWIVFQPRSSENVGLLEVDGHRPARLAWMDGACIAPVVLEPAPVVALDLHAALPDALVSRVSVRRHRDGGSTTWECGALDDQGRITVEADPGPWVLDLLLRDDRAFGLLRSVSVEVPDVEQFSVEVDLRDLEPLGYVDLDLRHDRDGPWLVVDPGSTPLAVGDELVASGALHPSWVATSHLLGPLDEPVVFTVRRGGDLLQETADRLPL